MAWCGPAWLHLQADLSRGMKDQPFLVTETNATIIGGSADNLPAYRGQRARSCGAWWPAAHA